MFPPKTTTTTIYLLAHILQLSMKFLGWESRREEEEEFMEPCNFIASLYNPSIQCLRGWFGYDKKFPLKLSSFLVAPKQHKRTRFLISVFSAQTNQRIRRGKVCKLRGFSLTQPVSSLRAWSLLTQSCLLLLCFDVFIRSWSRWLWI